MSGGIFLCLYECLCAALHLCDSEPQRVPVGPVLLAVYWGPPSGDPGSEGMLQREKQSEGDKKATCCLAGERWAPLSPRAHSSEGIWWCWELGQSYFPLSSNRGAVGRPGFSS